MLRARTLRVPFLVSGEPVTLVCRWPSRELLTADQFQALCASAAMRAAKQEDKANATAQRAAQRKIAEAEEKHAAALNDPTQVQAWAAHVKSMLQGIETAYSTVAETMCRLVIAQVDDNGQEVPLTLCMTQGEEQPPSVLCVERLGALPILWQAFQEVYLAEVTPFRPDHSRARG